MMASFHQMLHKLFFAYNYKESWNKRRVLVKNVLNLLHLCVVYAAKCGVRSGVCRSNF